MDEVMSDRDIVLSGSGKKGVDIVDKYEYAEYGQVICPIVCEGDIIGAVVVVGKDAGVQMGDAESRLAAVAAAFLGRQMESR